MITNTDISLGMRAVEEMHEKFSNQKNYKNQLDMEVKDAEKRLKQLTIVRKCFSR